MKVLIRLTCLENSKPWNFRAEGHDLAVHVLDGYLQPAGEWLVA
jgi:hypothetical protein